MTGLVVSLGDSLSCGEGVGLRVPPSRTWVALLAAALDARLECQARPGARVRDLRDHQLAAARAALARAQGEGAVTTLLVGLNDVASGDFDDQAFRRDLAAVVAGLGVPGTRLLVFRVHDPGRFFRAPAALRRRIERRVVAVNAAVDDLAPPGAAIGDLGLLPDLQSRTAWAVDRLHPAEAGHHAIAVAGLQALGVGSEHWPPAVSEPDPVGVCREVAWLVRHGLPWVGRHLGKVVPALLTDGSAAPDLSIPPPASQARVAASPASTRAAR